MTDRKTTLNSLLQTERRRKEFFNRVIELYNGGCIVKNIALTLSREFNISIVEHNIDSLLRKKAIPRTRHTTKHKIFKCNFCLTEEMYEKLKKMARKNYLPLSYQSRNIIEKALKDDNNEIK